MRRRLAGGGLPVYYDHVDHGHSAAVKEQTKPVVAAGQTRIALIEDHTLLADSMCVALSARGFDVPVVTGTDDVADADDVSASVAAHEPHVVLLDLHPGEVSVGLNLIEELSDSGCSVVVLTGEDEPAVWGACLAHGAETVLTESCPFDDVLDTVNHVAAGRTVIPQTIRQRLVEAWTRRKSQANATRDKLATLTPREEEILLALSRGSRVREIAQEWYVSEATVRTHVRAILHKLGVTSQIAAVAMARGTDNSVSQIPVQYSRARGQSASLAGSS